MAISHLEDFESNIIKALGLPNTTYSLTITMSAGDVSRGSCEFYIHGDMLSKVEAIMTMDVDSESKGRLLRMLDGD